VETRWPDAWGDVEVGYILNRTNGFNALMRFFRPAYASLTTTAQEVVSEGKFLDLFRNIELSNSDFTVENFPPGSSGEGRLFTTLLKQSGL